MTSTRVSRSWRAGALLALVAGALVGAAPAQAAFPGANGRIVFVSDRDGDREIYAMHPDGTGQVRLTASPGLDAGPAWSPDGRRLAFWSERGGQRDVEVVNADGTGRIRLTSDPAAEYAPAWSPDGRRIVYVREVVDELGFGRGDVWVMNADGSGQRRITTERGHEFAPAWSPDGAKIAFFAGARGGNELVLVDPDGGARTHLTFASGAGSGDPDWSPDGSRLAYMDDFSIYVINRDGTGRRLLTFDLTIAVLPGWAPDGSRIAFSAVGGDHNEDVYLMNPDGGGRVPLTTHAGADSSPDWQPRPLASRAPDCAGVAARPRSLWPPNHKLRPVAAGGATDPDGDPVTLAITGVTQDEPVDGRADGSTAPDARRTAEPSRLLLRAERSKKGDGRVYRVGFRAVDPYGGSCTGVALVEVRRTKKRRAVDSGLRVDSFAGA